MDGRMARFKAGVAASLSASGGVAVGSSAVAITAITSFGAATRRLLQSGLDVTTEVGYSVAAVTARAVRALT